MLFTNVKYTISSSLPEHRQTELEKVLDANGANKVDLRQATHVITDSLQFEGFEKVSPDAAIVSDEWVDRSLVHGKQQDTKLFSPDPKMIFSGVIACTVDMEPCDKEVITAGINALGGLYREAFTRDCTHVLAARPGSDKYNAAMHFRDATKVRIVLPHWFDDCFKLLVRLDEAPYEWPNPPLLSSHVEKPKMRLTVEQKALMEASKLADSQDPAKIEELIGSKNVWKGRKILLSKDLLLDKRRRQTVEISIRRAGGQVITLSEGLDEEGQVAEEGRGLEEADIYVTRYRYGPGYLKALQTNRTIGTLVWLFNVHKTGIISRPLDQLLHYPTPREPPPGFSSHKITITNYSGEARDYIKKLISLMDAEFTPTMTAANTVVIAAHINGNKTEKAREWSIPIVNHTWLEDCFVQWKNLTPALQKYIHYPEGINFGSMIGSRGIGQLPIDEEVESVEMKMQEDRERQLAEKKRLEEEKEASEKAKLEEARAKREEEQKAREALSPHKRKGASSKEQEREREASEVEEVDAAISLADGEDSQPLEHMDARSLRSSRSPAKRPSQAKPGPSKKPSVSKRAVVALEEEEEEQEQEEEEEEEDEEVKIPVQQMQPTRVRQKAAVAKPSMTRRKRVETPEPEEDEEEEIPKRSTRLANRPAPTTLRAEKLETKKGGKRRAEMSDDDSENIISPPKRGRGQLRRQAMIESPASSFDDAKVANNKAMETKGEGKNTALDNILRDLTDSDEGLSPIGKDKKRLKSTATLLKVGKHISTDQPLEEIPETKTEEVTKVGPPRGTARLGAKSSKTTTPQKPASSISIQNQASSASRKVATTEISSPPNARNAGSGVSRTQSIIAVAADGPSSTPKRKHPASRGRSPSPRSKGKGKPASPPQSLKEDNELSSQRPSYPLNGLQRTPSKRQAATMASLRLHETAQDMNNFQKEMRNGTVRGPWEKDLKNKGKLNGDSRKRRASSTSTVADASADEVEGLDPREMKRRKVDLSETDRKASRAQAENVPQAHAKRARFEKENLMEEADLQSKNRKGKKELSAELSPDNDIIYTVMTTKVSLNDSVQKALGKLGVKFTEKPAECNILITDGVGRTEKFLCAMSVVQQIVSIKWAEDSVRLKKILPPEDYALHDPEGEKKFGIKLADALKRARSSKTKLLQGHTFYVTPVIRTGDKFDTYKKVATSAGAKISTQMPTARMLEGHNERHIMSSPADKHIWRSLAEEGFPIYSPELLLMGVLKQDMEWDNRAYRLDSNV